MTLWRIFDQILNMSLTASWVILLVFAARFLLRKAPKIYSYLLWAVVLFRLLCPVSFSASWSAFRFTEASPIQEQGVTTRIEYVDVTQERLEPAEAPALPVQEVRSEEGFTIKAVLPWIWLAGTGSMLLYGVLTDIRFRCRLAGAVPLEKSIYLVDHMGTAFVAGLFRPRIYLPSDLPEREMAYILAHEKHHLQRCDPVVKHLSFLALALHWFNPLVWAAFFLSGKDMEMSCDEAVLQKLGPGIRADYAASLLHLAVGKRIIAGSPLAFGERDTGGRIRNMARWRRPKAWVRVLAMMLCAVVLAACAANPKAVPEKEEPQPSVPVTEPAEPEETAPPPQEFWEFSSEDGSVAYRILTGVELPTEGVSAVTVVPRKLTSGDFERVARTLVGEADCYEREPTVGAQYSKAQYQQMLDRMEPYANIEAMEELVGKEYALDQVVQLENTLDYIREAMKTAPEENPLTVTDWTLKKERIYNNGEWEYSGRPLSEDADWLVASSEINGMGCNFMGVVSDTGDRKLSRYLFQLGGASVDSYIDREIYWKELCRTGEPTEEQIQAAQKKVLDLLSKMEHGDWQIAKVEVQQDWTGSEREYRLYIHAVPVLNGVPAFHGQDVPQPVDETGTYVLTEADFLLSANGDVLDMVLDMPLEVKALGQEGAMPYGELMKIAQEKLSSLDAANWGIRQEDLTAYREHYEPDIACEVTVSQLEFGMYRQAGQGNTYTYVPMLALRGNAQYRGETSGRVYYSNEEYGPLFLIGINALDGTIIGP